MEENPQRHVPFHFLRPPSGNIGLESCSFMHMDQLPSLPCLISSWGYSNPF